jgi:putative oxidoreductase
MWDSEERMKSTFLLGRLIFGGYFISSGINHFRNRKNLAEYAKAKKVPLANVAVPATGALMLAGGASLILGLKPRYGALAILGFLAAVSPVMHDFWRQEDANQRMSDMINFTKNMGLAGAALAIMSVDEPWPLSVPVAQPTRLERVRKIMSGRIAA